MMPIAILHVKSRIKLFFHHVDVLCLWCIRIVRDPFGIARLRLLYQRDPLHHIVLRLNVVRLMVAGYCASRGEVLWVMDCKVSWAPAA